MQITDHEPIANPVPNAIVLMFILGWQGGTVHQVARALDVEVSYIMNAGYDQMCWLMRLAQQERARIENTSIGERVKKLSIYGS